MNLSNELEKLSQLRQSGAINDNEFALAKARLLSGPSEAFTGSLSSPESTRFTQERQEQQTRQWAFFLHLSVLAGFLVPFGGFVVPIVIWQMKKDGLPGIDIHGKNALNWIISKIIYLAVSGILVLLVIGIPLLIVLGIVGVIFPVIAAIKANNGEIWKYPLAIPFLK